MDSKIFEVSLTTRTNSASKNTSDRFHVQYFYCDKNGVGNLGHF